MKSIIHGNEDSNFVLQSSHFHVIFCGFALFNQNGDLFLFYVNLDRVSTGK